MSSWSPIFNKWHIFFILVSGTVFRFIYGYSTSAWLSAPDQLAWGLSLDEMVHSKNWSYLQLIHYPHEGGSLLMSLLSIIFRPLHFIMPPLSIAALTLDTFSRYIQLKTVQKVWGNETALWYGIWSIAAIPVLIPWATVNFGLHALSSFFPFLFLYIVVPFRDNKKLPVICGIVVGVAVSFSYDSIVLLITCISLFLFFKEEWKDKLTALLKFIVVSIIVLIPHLFIRLFLKTGFEWEGNSLLSIRGIESNNLVDLSKLFNVIRVWHKVLPGSFFLSSVSFLNGVWLRAIVYLFILSGMLLYLIKNQNKRQLKFISLIIVLIFLAFYSVSPFYIIQYVHKSFVLYRHLTYIIPLLVVIMMNGFIQAGKFKIIILTCWTALCIIASIQYISYTKRDIIQPDYRATGWITAKKFGTDTAKLIRVYSITDKEHYAALLQGYGWAFTSSFLENKTEADTLPVKKLIDLINQFPGELKSQVVHGVYYSFKQGITPELDKRLIPVIDYYLKLSGDNFSGLPMN